MNKLSIITINYNNKEGLQRTIDSVCSQSYHDYEWIIIDGNSNDGSKELIEENADLFSYWVSEPDKGIYDAMNKGIAVATGEYCQFLNSGDSFIDTNVLEKVFLDNDLSDVNYGDQWCVSNGIIIEKRSYPDKMSLLFLFRSPLGHQASFIKTELVKRHLYKEQYTISADRAFFLELYFSGCTFYHIPLPIVFFDVDGIGSNRKTLQERRNQFYQIKREFIPNQVVEDIEFLLGENDEMQFVRRIKPLYWLYIFMKKLQKLKCYING